jgi:hemolysin activation/secretion protein
MTIPASNAASDRDRTAGFPEFHNSARRSRRALESFAGLVLASGLAASALAAETGGPVGSPAAAQTSPATFQIQSFEVTGSTRLSPTQIREALQDATGPNVNLSRIRASLVRLQQAYRDAGLPNASVVLPRQPLTNGIAAVRVIEDASAPAPRPVLPGWTVPSFEVRHFVVQGNSVLSAEEINQVLGNVSGDSVSPEKLQTALRQLREAYVARGYSNAAVLAPSQVLTDGTVALRIMEGALSRTTVAAATNTPPAPAFEVRRYNVRGNTLLPAEQLEQILASGTGDKVTLPQIQKALGDLQLAYRDRGWATVAVSLPQQQLTNAIVQVQVVEGTLTDIQVTGNRHFSSNNVVRALPSLRTNTLLNSRVFQRELDLANQDRDRQIYPVVGPGPEPGTSALTLRVKDRFPLHGRVDVHNQSGPALPEWRINSSVQYRNLWQREHQVGFFYGFSPESFKNPTPDLDFLLNRPQVAFYGGYYRLPLGQPESVEQQIRANPGFGFDEGSRQFRLPPASSRPDISFFANAASVDTGVQFTPDKVVSQTPLLTIVSRDSGRNVIGIESGGAKLNLPFVFDDRRRLNLSAGVEGKHFGLESFNTNNFVITTVVTNAQGSQTIRSDLASPQPTRTSGVTYLPLTFAADYSQTDSGGSTTVGLTLTGNFLGHGAEFDGTAYSAKADPAFGKAVLNFRREQKLYREWSASVRASGQLATGPLLPTESLFIGGISSVRGYFEGEDFGDHGWIAGLDLLTPQYKFQFSALSEPVPSWIRGFTFFDAGQRFLSDAPAGSPASQTLWSVGVGLSANVNNLLDLRVTLGIPLADSNNREAYSPRANVSLGGQF